MKYSLFTMNHHINLGGEIITCVVLERIMKIILMESMFSIKSVII